MGNLLAPPGSDYNSETGHDRYYPGRPSQGRTSLSTDRALYGIETHLSSMQQSVRTMRGIKDPREAQQQLINEISDTEKKLACLKQQLQPQERRGKTAFNSQRHGDDNDSEHLVKTLISQIDKLGHENESLCAKLREEKEKNEKAETNNKDLLLRLSKVAGERLVENNPAIADLNDHNRPTKLGEIYSELYDNEWTDAVQGLQEEGYDDEYAISTLLLTFINVLDFCKRKAESMLVKTEDAVNFLFEDYKLIHETMQQAHFMTIPRGKLAWLKPSDMLRDIKLHERWRKKTKSEVMQQSVQLQVKKSETIETKIKALRKETAELMVPVVQKAYLKATWRNGEFVPALKPFIRKCIFVCWMMVVQSPPMCIHEVEMREDLKFDKNYFKEYTVRGPTVKYFVWPALLLHENGPVVCKGIAQGC